MGKPFYKMILFACFIFGISVLNGYADRLYTWEDDNGLTHISKNPPPPNAKSKSVLDYSKQSLPQDQDALQNSQTRNEERETVEAAEKLNERPPAETAENVEPEYYDEDGLGVRRQLDRYDEREKALNDREKRQGQDEYWPEERAGRQEEGRSFGGPARFGGGRR